MQACNLQNLPENYTMRYCKLLALFHLFLDLVLKISQTYTTL
jgi:hypothetical protein